MAVDLRPITVFFGANSSGKSTCIHALAALAQTMKLGGNRQPLVLDDEYSQIHLGRYIEVVHSRNYKRPLQLGGEIILPKLYEYPESANQRRLHKNVRCQFEITIGCTKRTQEIRVDEVKYSMGLEEIVISRKSGQGGYLAQRKNAKRSATAVRREAFMFGIKSETRDSVIDDLPLHFLLEEVQQGVAEELKKVKYLGPFRQPPQRRYATRGSMPSEVGAMGEASITLLANEQIQTRARPNIGRIATWLKTLGLANAFEVRRVGQSDQFDAKMSLADDVTLPLADLGYGLSQVLPVLTQCSFAPDNATLLFEQPELHLHSIAARRLASVFVDTVKWKACNILIETHSKEIVAQLQEELRNKRIKIEDVIIYKVRRVGGSTRIAKVPIESDDFDIFDDWERGVTMA